MPVRRIQEASSEDGWDQGSQKRCEEQLRAATKNWKQCTYTLCTYNVSILIGTGVEELRQGICAESLSCARYWIRTIFQIYQWHQAYSIQHHDPRVKFVDEFEEREQSDDRTYAAQLHEDRIPGQQRQVCQTLYITASAVWMVEEVQSSMDKLSPSFS